MDDKPVFITDDKGGKLHSVDEEVRNPNPDGVIAITSVDMLMELAEMAQATMAAFQADFKDMTLEQAQFARRLRVDQDCTWRSVADECNHAWDGDWGSNQLAGMAICERAAQLHGEDYMQAPWN